MKIFRLLLLALLAPSLLCAAQQDIATIDDITASRLALRTAVNTELDKVQDNFTELYGQAATKWASGTAYTADNTMVVHGGNLFVCTDNHTAGATTEPGTGADWATVWAYSGAALWEPIQTAASQAEMEAGTESAIRSMSPLRVAQAIAALGGSGSDELVYQADCSSITDGFCVDTDDQTLYYYDGSTVAEVAAAGTTDADAIHDNVSGEIAAITAKATPASGDYFIIEDSAASNAKKSLLLSALFSWMQSQNWTLPGTITMTGTVNLPLSLTLPNDSVAAAQMADADHGDVAWSSGVATIDPGVVTAAKIADWYAYDVIPIGWCEDGSSPPDALDDTTRDPLAYRTFASDADEDVNCVWFVPSDLSGTTVQYRVKYLITNATGPSATEGVAFGLSGISAGDNDASNGTKGTVVVITDDTLNAAQHDVLITGWSGDVTITNLAAGEVAELAFIRDVSDAVDDYGQVVGVLGFEIRYVRNVAR